MDTDMGFNRTEYLVDKFLDDIIRLCLVYVRNMDDAQDVAQQVFVTYLQKKPVFENDEHAKNWLLKVAVNMSKNHVRLQRRGEISFDELKGALSTEDDRRDGRTEQEEAVFGAVMRLKQKHREIIHLYYYSGYNTNELSEMLGIPAASVRSRLTRARAALEKELKGGICDAGRLQKSNEPDNG